MTGNWQDAKDAVQEALVKAYLVWARIEQPDAYLHRPVINAADSSYRARAEVAGRPAVQLYEAPRASPSVRFSGRAGHHPPRPDRHPEHQQRHGDLVVDPRRPLLLPADRRPHRGHTADQGPRGGPGSHCRLAPPVTHVTAGQQADCEVGTPPDIPWGCVVGLLRTGVDARRRPGPR